MKVKITYIIGEIYYAHCWKTQYYEDVNPPQIDLQIQYNPYQNSSWSLGRNWRAEPRIQIQVTQNSQYKAEKGGQMRGLTLFSSDNYYKAMLIRK